MKSRNEPVNLQQTLVAQNKIVAFLSVSGNLSDSGGFYCLQPSLETPCKRAIKGVFQERELGRMTYRAGSGKLAPRT